MTFIEGVKELSRAWRNVPGTYSGPIKSVFEEFSAHEGSYTIIVRRAGSLWDVELIGSGLRNGDFAEQLALKLTLRKAVNLAFEKKVELSKECYTQIVLLEK